MKELIKMYRDRVKNPAVDVRSKTILFDMLTGSRQWYIDFIAQIKEIDPTELEVFEKDLARIEKALALPWRIS